MDLKILIATPDRSLGEQLSRALHEAGYAPLVAPSTAEAAFIVQDEKCPIAVLDCELPDPGSAYLAAELRARFKDLRIIFIHPGESGTEMVEVNPARDIQLPRPFFLPDLLEVIHLWVAEKKAALDEAQATHEPQEIPPEMAWLSDVNQAAQYLTRLSLEADAQAALIIRNSRIWAYAGQLSQNAAEELTQFVGHHWANGDGSDLARFARLETTGSEYMLYATSLGSGFVLALSFETEMPFSKMRTQTGELARKLTSPLDEPPIEDTRTQLSEKPPKLEADVVQASEEWTIEIADDEGEYNRDDWSVDDELLEQQQAMFEELLATLDIPDPDGLSGPPLEHAEKLADVQHQTLVETPEPEEVNSLLLETVPTQLADPLTQSDVLLEPESFALHDLAYACVLIPRLPDHHLTGVLTGLLNVEMPRLCIAFGWRLEHLAIRPQYLHWVVSVAPDVPASRVIQKIRKHTSTLIFNEFPRLAKENPSNDFWAPGFMVVHGRRSMAGSLVQDFIQQTRARQGVDKQ
jgi:DNA-binding response OmpR family regulator/REP element-mobilizing transposase RayT